jgi:hypothetical protein
VAFPATVEQYGKNTLYHAFFSVGNIYLEYQFLRGVGVAPCGRDPDVNVAIAEARGLSVTPLASPAFPLTLLNNVTGAPVAVQDKFTPSVFNVFLITYGAAASSTTQRAAPREALWRCMLGGARFNAAAAAEETDFTAENPLGVLFASRVVVSAPAAAFDTQVWLLSALFRRWRPVHGIWTPKTTPSKTNAKTTPSKTTPSMTTPSMTTPSKTNAKTKSKAPAESASEGGRGQRDSDTFDKASLRTVEWRGVGGGPDFLLRESAAAVDDVDDADDNDDDVGVDGDDDTGANREAYRVVRVELAVASVWRARAHLAAVGLLAAAATATGTGDGSDDDVEEVRKGCVRIATRRRCFCGRSCGLVKPTTAPPGTASTTMRR